MTDEPRGWMLQAQAKKLADVGPALRKAKAATLAPGDLDPAIGEEIDILIKAATDAAKLLKGKGTISVQAAGSSRAQNVRLTVIASRGGGSQ